jgi:cytidylate kinase
LKKKTKLPFPILIAGRIGSGKSTLAKSLAKKYHARYISASFILWQMAIETLSLKNPKKIGQGFWETPDGKKMLELRQKNPKYDKEVDRRLLTYLKKYPSTISDGWMMPWLYKGKALRIWLEASETTRVQRIMERDTITRTEARKSLHFRTKKNYALYKKLYGIEWGNDRTPFDLVVANDGLEPSRTFRVVKTYIEERLHSLP